jgi:hypothetical protein
MNAFQFVIVHREFSKRRQCIMRRKAYGTGATHAEAERLADIRAQSLDVVSITIRPNPGVNNVPCHMFG